MSIPLIDFDVNVDQILEEARSLVYPPIEDGLRRKVRDKFLSLAIYLSFC
jgi:hypothetical protein